MDNHKPKKPWFKRVWVWIGIIVLVGIAASAASPKETPAPAATTPATTAEAPKEEAPAKWDMEAAYAKINNGMTKAEVEEATGKKSESCTESVSEYIGKTEYCSYGNAFIDKGSISVVYSQDVVSSKTKSKY